MIVIESVGKSASKAGFLTDSRRTKSKASAQERMTSVIVEKTTTVTNKSGLHARPATLFVQTAAKFKSNITVTTPTGNTANAKSIMSVLTLGAEKGTTITLRAEGDDAEEAIDTLIELMASNFGEGE